MTMNVSAKRASIAAASTLVAAGLVVGGVVSTSDAATTTATKTVNITMSHYQPGSLKIKVGTKVKWHNSDSMPHTVTWSGKYGLQNKVLGPGATTPVITFGKAGTFKYHCVYHPMSGTVVVTK